MTRLDELCLIPEHMLSHDEWRERELLKHSRWQDRLVNRMQTPEAQAYHEQIGCKPGQPVSAISREDRMRFEEDDQRRVERDPVHNQ